MVTGMKSSGKNFIGIGGWNFQAVDAVSLHGVGLDHENAAEASGPDTDIGVGPLFPVASDLRQVACHAPLAAAAVLFRLVRLLLPAWCREDLPCRRTKSQGMGKLISLV